MRDALAELNYQVVSSVLGEPTVEQMLSTVLSAHDVFSKVLAYTAATHVSGVPLELDALTGDSAAHWADYVGDNWQRRLALWQSLPDAWHACVDQQWPQALMAGLKLEQQTMTTLGFAYEPVDDGVLFLRTGADELFNRRLTRAQNDFPE